MALFIFICRNKYYYRRLFCRKNLYIYKILENKNEKRVMFIKKREKLLRLSYIKIR